MFTIQKKLFSYYQFITYTFFYQNKKEKKIKPEQQNQKNNQHTIAQDFLRKRIP